MVMNGVNDELTIWQFHHSTNWLINDFYDFYGFYDFYQFPLALSCIDDFYDFYGFNGFNDLNGLNDLTYWQKTLCAMRLALCVAKQYGMHITRQRRHDAHALQVADFISG